MSFECECPVAGFCVRHRANKSRRDWQLCQGVDCSKEQQEKYQNLWDEMAAEKQVATPTATRSATAVPPKVYEPIPRTDWPAAANLIAMLAAPSDVGVGDTIKRQLGIAGKLYQAAFRALTGGNCAGCGFRQNKWNQLYPYER